MGKFRCKVGYGIPTETSKGIWENVLIERYYRGDILQDQTRWDSSSDINDNLNISNRFSIVADNFMRANRMHILYIVIDDIRWKVHNIDLSNRPRIIFTISGVYNGPEVNDEQTRKIT